MLLPKAAQAAAALYSSALLGRASNTSICPWFEIAANNPQNQILYDLVKQYNIPKTNFGATVLALIYSSPLNLYNSSEAIFPTNVVTANPSAINGSSSLPAPNTDVIYGRLSYDLGQQNLVLSFPPYQSDRFYGFTFYDPFQETYEAIGAVDGNPPGDYLLRPTVGSGERGLSTENCPKEYVACVNSPTYAGILVNRVELYNTSDTDYVVSYLQNITLTVSERRSALVAPLDPVRWQNVSSNRFVNALEVVAMLGSRNPPQNSDLAASLPGLMACAGIDFTTETYTPVPGVNVTLASEMWKNITDEYLALPGSVQELGNNWVMFNTTIIGGFRNSTALVARTEYQIFGNLPDSADQTVYIEPKNTSLNVGDNQAYLVNFSGKPPLKSFGFWNFEAYNSAASGVAGLVSNPQGIYSVGKNTNITYPDGTLVYGANNTKPDNTPFQILFQSSNTPPPANWTNNWMPTPINDGSFTIAMRIYGEDEVAISSGSYIFPVQQQISAITRS